jgi:type II secretory pathway component PulJ
MGFTLVETLVAMLLVSAVVLPASLWLYRTRTHHAAWERFRATQLLEDRMNRALLLRPDRDQREREEGPTGLRFEIEVEEEGDETRLIGKAVNHRGRTVVTLEAALFERDEGRGP